MRVDRKAAGLRGLIGEQALAVALKRYGVGGKSEARALEINTATRIKERDEISSSLSFIRVAISRKPSACDPRFTRIPSEKTTESLDRIGPPSPIRHAVRP